MVQNFRGVRKHMPAGSGRYPSGQRGQTVNLLAYAFGGSNPPLPTIVATAVRTDRVVGGLSEMGVDPTRATERVTRTRVPVACASVRAASAGATAVLAVSDVGI